MVNQPLSLRVWRPCHIWIGQNVNAV